MVRRRSGTRAAGCRAERQDQTVDLIAVYWVSRRLDGTQAVDDVVGNVEADENVGAGGARDQMTRQIDDLVER
jgi:hypothetical protein